MNKIPEYELRLVPKEHHHVSCHGCVFFSSDDFGDTVCLGEDTILNKESVFYKDFKHPFVFADTFSSQCSSSTYYKLIHKITEEPYDPYSRIRSKTV